MAARGPWSGHWRTIFSRSEMQAMPTTGRTGATHQVRLTVTDPARSRAFYELLGLQLAAWPRRESPKRIGGGPDDRALAAEDGGQSRGLPRMTSGLASIRCNA